MSNRPPRITKNQWKARKKKAKYEAFKRALPNAYEEAVRNKLDKCPARRAFEIYEADEAFDLSTFGPEIASCDSDCICYRKCMKEFDISVHCPKGKPPMGACEVEACVSCKMIYGRCRFERPKQEFTYPYNSISEY